MECDDCESGCTKMDCPKMEPDVIHKKKRTSAWSRQIQAECEQKKYEKQTGDE